MKVAVVTGATSGIGLAISKKLLELGYLVYGVGRDFGKVDIEDENFNKVVCNLEDYKEVERLRSEKKIKNIDVLVNCAGVGYFGLHEEIKNRDIHRMVVLNLEAPLILTQMYLRDIKRNRGIIINISSITAKKSSTYGCAYSATKAGLAQFSKSLFDEVRKTGARVVTVYPDITKTPFYDNLFFREGDEEESYILPECVADCVENILSLRDGTVITEVVLQPQKHIVKRK